MVAFAYALGVFWYDLLPGKLATIPWRVAAYPLALMILAEAYVPLGPTFLGFHPGTAVIASLIGVIIDWIITYFRHPESVVTPEMRTATVRS